ncbi:hypothetical protein NDU88_001709 [Pleurodeles waltl]|uniref:Integrase zinc-binding domain-containing protein n=1 Tax=Pleurodeles waltl TaxID=8319 RepID=A0AAV7M1V6_PLEWA|nr:hypothetical protein NDU88_001709 [Pleurodeles waltl]
MPSCLTSRALSLADGAHQGIAKSKYRLRNKVWFPGPDQLVEDTVKGCLSAKQAELRIPQHWSSPETAPRARGRGSAQTLGVCLTVPT